MVDPSGSAEKPVFRRDGGAVFYSSVPAAGGTAQLFEIDLATRAHPSPGARPRTSDQHTVAVSPARDEIAFVGERDGRADLWLMPLPDGPRAAADRTRPTGTSTRPSGRRTASSSR